MLVLARQLHERIVMPTVPATIEVVAVKPNGVRLGIEAAPEVTVLREEILRRDGSASGDLLALSEGAARTQLNRVKLTLRNRLQGVALGLDLIRRQMEESGTSELQGMLRRMETEVRRIGEQLRILLSSSELRSSNDVTISPCITVETEGGLSI